MKCWRNLVLWRRYPNVELVVNCRLNRLWIPTLTSRFTRLIDYMLSINKLLVWIVILVVKKRWHVVDVGGQETKIKILSLIRFILGHHGCL